jgi:hypothetical protein
MTHYLCCPRFKSDQTYFCPPPSRRNTGSKDEDREVEKIDKVRSALGVTYKAELHFAVGHMRRWDGAYPVLTNGTKAVDLMAGEKVPRCVVLG